MQLLSAPSFLCSLVENPLNVLVNSGSSIVVIHPGISYSKDPALKEKYGFKYRGNKHLLSSIHFRFINGAFCYVVTRHSQETVITVSDDISEWDAYHIICDDKLTALGKKYIAEILLKEINLWYVKNYQEVKNLFLEYNTKLKLEKIADLQEKIAELEEQKKKLEVELNNLTSN